MSRPTRPTIEVTKHDKGLKELIAIGKRIARNKPYAKGGVIGVAAGKKHPDEGATNVEVALWNEFGTRGKRNIPERSFIRSAFEAHRSEYQVMASNLLREVLSGNMTERRALGLLGLKLSSDIKNGITLGAGIQPPNAPSTLARKAAKTRRPRGFIGPLLSPRALVDTGQLVGAISWEVVLKGDDTTGGGE